MNKLSAPFYRTIVNETLPALNKKVFEGTFKRVLPKAKSFLIKAKDYLKHYLYTKPVFQAKKAIGDFGWEAAKSADVIHNGIKSTLVLVGQNVQLNRLLRTKPPAAKQILDKILENKESIRKINSVIAGKVKNISKNAIIGGSPLIAAGMYSSYLKDIEQDKSFAVNSDGVGVRDNQAQLKELIDKEISDRNESLTYAAALPAMQLASMAVVRSMAPGTMKTVGNIINKSTAVTAAIGVPGALTSASIANDYINDLKKELSKKQSLEKKSFMKVSDEFSDKIKRDRLISKALSLVPLALIPSATSALLSGDPKKMIPMFAIRQAATYLPDLIDSPKALTKLRWMANKEKWDDRDLDLIEELLYDDKVIDEYTGLNKDEQTNFINRLEDLKSIKGYKQIGKEYYNDIKNIIKENPSKFEKIKGRMGWRTLIESPVTIGRLATITGAAYAGI